MVIAFAISRHHQSIRSLPNGRSSNNDYLDELWINSADKIVAYNPPLWQAWKTSTKNFIFTLLPLALYYGNILCKPFRRSSLRICVDWLLNCQEPSGDWMSYSPTEYMTLLALQDEGFGINNDVVTRGLKAMKRLLWEDGRGKRLQACPSATWDTALMILGLYDADQTTNNPALTAAVEWLDSHQCLDTNAHWRISKPELTVYVHAFICITTSLWGLLLLVTKGGCQNAANFWYQWRLCLVAVGFENSRY
jgi:squalene-hopene/tetraprenyl-beta-curcumene cyclase